MLLCFRRCWMGGVLELSIYPTKSILLPLSKHITHLLFPLKDCRWVLVDMGQSHAMHRRWRVSLLFWTCRVTLTSLALWGHSLSTLCRCSVLEMVPQAEPHNSISGHSIRGLWPFKGSWITTRHWLFICFWRVFFIQSWELGVWDSHKGSD